MKKVFVIVYENENDFFKGSNIIAERFTKPDNAIEYCGSWGKNLFNKDECLNAIYSTVNHFIQMPEKSEIYFGCDRGDISEIKTLLLSENCEIIITSYADFVS